MAKIPVVSSDTFPRLVKLLVVVMVLVNLSFVFFVLLSLSSISRYERNFRVDEAMFARHVGVAVSNFLDSATGGGLAVSDPELDSVVDDLQVSFVDSPDIGFFGSAHGDYLVVRGIVFRRGDYCPYGQVVYVDSSRAYVYRDGSYIVLRSSRGDPPTAVGAVREPVSASADEDSATRL